MSKASPVQAPWPRIGLQTGSFEPCIFHHVELPHRHKQVNVMVCVVAVDVWGVLATDRVKTKVARTRLVNRLSLCLCVTGDRMRA